MYSVSMYIIIFACMYTLCMYVYVCMYVYILDMYACAYVRKVHTLPRQRQDRFAETQTLLIMYIGLHK